MKLIAAEAAGLGVDSGESAATIHLGKEGIIHGSRTLVMQTEDGQIVEPYSISAGLDYPGIGPLHAYLAKSGRSEVTAVTDAEALSAASTLTRLEGIIPALESAHALAVLDQMQFASESGRYAHNRRFGKDDVIVVNVSGRGDKDMETYLAHL